MAEDSDVFEEIDLKSLFGNEKLKKYWYFLPLAFIFYIALKIRMMTANSGLFIGIDPYYLSRMTEYLVTHDFHMPLIDTMRYAPTGWNPALEVNGIFYLPGVIYSIINSIIGIDFHSFAIQFPAVMGALIVIPLFYLGRELHNEYTGLFAAFFYSVSNSVLFRTSAGFFEKESIAGFMMLVGLYFFIRSIKRDSLISGLIGGLSIGIMATIWGGVQQILLGIVGYVFLVILVNKQTTSLLKAYAPVVFISLGYYGTGSSIAMMNYIAFTLLVLRYVLERFDLVKKSVLPYLGPVMYVAGGFVVFIGAIFSKRLASLVMSTQRYLFYSKEVIESTVAENVDASWTDFIGQFGSNYAEALFPSLSPIASWGSMWIFAFLAVYVVLHKFYKEKDKFFMLGVLSWIVSVVSYYIFMNTKTASMQTYFVFSFMIVLITVARKSHLSALLMLLMYSSMLGFASKVRFAFILGPYIAIMAGYFMSNFISFVKNSKVMQEAVKLEEKINIYSVVALVGIAFVVGMNFSSGYVLAQSMAASGPSFTSNWQEAMDFLKTNTTEDSVILSWWDFGYWFQTMGERPTNLDGGNNMATRNRPTAQYFTGMMNESFQKYYLNKFDTDYVLVDASMIGKYAAMSKIANYGDKVDSYIGMSYKDVVQQGNVSVVIYSAGPYYLWVPVNQMGALDGNIVLSVQGQEVYVSSLCTANGVVSLDPPNDKQVIDSCVFLTQGTAYFASSEIANSVFTKLYLMDGKGIDYLEQVFNNGEIKIYKVNLNKSTDSELEEWWSSHDAFDLMVS